MTGQATGLDFATTTSRNGRDHHRSDRTMVLVGLVVACIAVAALALVLVTEARRTPEQRRLGWENTHSFP